MSRKAGIAGVAAVACLLCVWAVWRANRGAEDRPGPRHVLLITLDTTRADRMGFLGYRAGDQSPTPNLDALAAESVVYPEAFAAVPLTLPSHATILTGLEPFEHGVRENSGFALVPPDQRDFRTAAELLREAGFRGAAFLSGETLDARYGLSVGFDRYEDLSAANRLGVAALDDRDAAATTELALGWIEDRPERSFTWVHYFDPHQPLVHHGPDSDRMLAAGATLYEGEIAWMDRQIGRLLQACRARGEWDDTLVIVVGDHGEGLGEHDEETHGLLVHDATIRVPFLVKYPRGRRPDARPASTLDVFPTLEDLLGRTPTPGRGASLLREAPAGRGHYAESVYSWRQFGWAPLRSVRVGDWKLIAEGDERRLYDWRRDPGELEDRAAARPDLVASLGDELRRLRAEAPPRIRGEARRSGPGHVHGGYFESASDDIPAEPRPDQEASLPRPSERMGVYRALDLLRLELDRVRSREGGERVAALITARGLLERLDERAREDNPAAVFWRARARLILAGLDDEDGWPAEFRREVLTRSIAGFGAYQALRPRDGRAFDQANLARLELHRFGGGEAPLREIEESVRAQEGLGLAGARASPSARAPAPRSGTSARPSRTRTGPCARSRETPPGAVSSPICAPGGDRADRDPPAARSFPPREVLSCRVGQQIPVSSPATRTGGARTRSPAPPSGARSDVPSLTVPCA
ncbi:MAG: sulfatase-like hydrolase/transferase [Planctomycetota bacterium]